MITEKLARTTCWVTTAHRLYRLLRPFCLIKLYLSLYICSCHWAQRLPGGRVLERPKARKRIPCRTRVEAAQRKEETDPMRRIQERRKRPVETQESCRISDLLFKSRATGHRARFRVIGPKFGGIAWAMTPNKENNSWQVSGSDGELPAGRRCYHCRCGRERVRACKRTIREGIQDPGATVREDRGGREPSPSFRWVEPVQSLIQ